jgi:iron complex outermembrane receptor protein
MEIEVTVSGDHGETKPGTRDEGVASSVISRQSLEAPGVQAQDVLRMQPGVLVTESGGFGAPATACIRGASAADTPVYLSGIRLNDDVGGTADLSMIPLWLIHHVEIYRGNAPLDADRLGAGGAIFFEPIRPTKPMGGVGYMGGSWGTSRYWAYNGSRVGRVSYLVGLSADRATNRYPFETDGGYTLSNVAPTVETRKNADASTFDGWFLGRAELGKQFVLDWASNFAYREQGVPHLALLQSNVARQSTERDLFSSSVRGPLSESGNVALEARTSYLRGVVRIDDPSNELAINTPKLSFNDQRVEQLLAVPWSVTNAFTLRPVVQFAFESIARDPDNVLIDKSTRQWIRLATSAEYDVHRNLVIRGLLSGDCHHTKVKDTGYCDELAPTGRFGTELRFENVKLFASAGHYLRVPTLGENYGVSGAIHGNPDLIPETGNTVDVGIRAAAYPKSFVKKLYLDAFAYQRWANDLVAYTRTTQGFIRPFNVNSARVLGAEILAGSRITEWIGAEMAVTLMDPRDTSTNRQATNDILPFRSRLILAPKIRFDWQRTRSFGLSGAGAQLSVLYQSNRFASEAGLGVIDEQISTDLDGYIHWFNGTFTVRGRVANVFNARRTDIVGYPLPGRSFYTTLEARY